MSKLSRGWIAAGVLALLIALLIGFLAVRYPEALAGRDGQISLTHSLLILAFVGGSLFLRGRLPVGHVVRYALIWVALGAGLVLAYSFRFEAASLGERVMAELVPHRGQETAAGVVIRAGDHGHFVVEAEVDGQPLRYLVDTGASDVVLSPADADRLGFDRAALDFSRTYRTANGTVRGAPVRLGRIAIGSVVVEDVRASVNGAEMQRSLLGMSFLSRLRGYEVRDDRLILKP
ncbi:MAG: TIGR02281 family clan AA aspartic protease [Magnetovibrio sp.]|nr:TIGR02281 family clan AA aspartic protease [Magnetovibrio sp.]